MVTFLCDGCNETIKKNKVDAHAAKCHSCYAVSCVDCSVSFPGDTYRSHTSCISEAERYEKTVYKGVRKLDQQNNPSSKKALTKQEKWLLIIEKAAESSPSSLKTYMDTLTSLENIPTQEKKFRNFASNSLRLKKSDEKIIAQIWELLMKEKQKQTEAAAAEKEKQEKSNKVLESAKISDEENSKEIEKEKPLKNAPNAEELRNDLPDDSKVKKAMKKALKKSSNEMKFKCLRKEVKRMLLLRAGCDDERATLKKITSEKWKVFVKRIVEDNPKKMKLSGKSVKLIT